MRKVFDTEVFPFCVEVKGEAWEEGDYIDNIRFPSVRPLAAFCYTEIGMWKRSMEEGKVQCLGAVCFIPNVAS